MILFGSAVRHENRQPSDPSPSDVDLLAIFDKTDRLLKPYREGNFATIIDAYALHLDAPREVNVLLSDRTMQAWDSMFLENLARDGILLFTRAVPYPLHSLHESLCNGLLKRRNQTLRTTSSYGRIFRYADHVVNPLQTLATRIPVNQREMGCETRCS